MVVKYFKVLTKFLIHSAKSYAYAHVILHIILRCSNLLKAVAFFTMSDLVGEVVCMCDYIEHKSEKILYQLIFVS